MKLSGTVFGTRYNIIYASEINYQPQIDSIFNVLDKSMSTYREDSFISKINKNISNHIDQHFVTVFDASKVVYKETKGAFDPTIGAVVNAWNFGPEGGIKPLDSLKIDSLMTFVGLDKVTRERFKIKKSNPHTFLDFSAIAKGYSVDVIGRFLESKNISNYLIEIGGEIRSRGVNAEKLKPWQIGIEMPHFDGTQSIIRTISLNNASIASSGVYRKFKIDENGNRYSHIIDTDTGYPSKTNLLSISVIASNCMLADAYATAFKSMGIPEITKFLENRKDIKVFLIFENKNKVIETLALNKFPNNYN